ncbi:MULTISPECIES: hypothetical protein [Bradyrhizobium]|uniref:hypothetical protein n=1 Tax=Bradyrhizobium TaxID=374 RepID=UPI001B8A8503|nr:MULTISPECIES: hypothetical protein [Bradyrhizobium]MBR0970616.1 hypothetical protein [Bradyrhizobium japonicum]
MAHLIKQDSANFELSIDQLDEVAGGGWFSSVTHFIHDAGQAIGKFLSSTPVAVLAGIFVGGGAIVVGGQAAMKQN